MNQQVENIPISSFLLSKWEKVSSYALSLVSKYGEAAKIAVPLVILGCFCCVWICVKLLRSRRKPKPKFLDRRSKTFRELYGGDIALRRLFENHEAEPSSAAFDTTDSVMKGLLDHEHLELKKLQTIVGKVEKSGTVALAVEQLKKAEKEHSGNPHEAYEIGMLLVELLIYEGKYKEALRSDCLKHEEISDARRPLYKAIIYIMLGDDEIAEKCWEEFSGIRELFHIRKPPSSSSSSLGEAIDHITDFQTFKNKVMKFKTGIHQDIAAKRESRK
ncbi:hypothetical protein QN277_020468 [Acacia crassicarpa]|uniref:Uncharacterized protein n=1 Tax=Acacia crassicarpa TaxID=499986 RepID=A0AAE1KEY3_9FABA|nr:hypothetical protein QN277_020468 [Acacia crassicarpa]